MIVFGIQGKFPGVDCTLVCNLEQNPCKRPLVQSWMPALLKSGCMFLLAAKDDVPQNQRKEERWMIESVSWHCISVSVLYIYIYIIS